MNMRWNSNGFQPSEPAAIVCSDLFTPYITALKRPALQGVNFAIQAGEFVTLLGLNGAGKSTLLRSLVGLVPVQKGMICINGVSATTATWHRARRDLGILFQGGGLVPQLTALENVLCGRLGQLPTWKTLSGFSRCDRRRAVELLQQLGLEKQIDQKTSLLSGGQRQRVAIARILIQSPKILLIDEPITGLDVLAAKQVMDIFAQLHQQGMTIVAVLHDLTIAADYAQRAIVLDAGQITYDGACENLPSHLCAPTPR
jgi:phosphonate transport system ATP-binding protein